MALPHVLQQLIERGLLAAEETRAFLQRVRAPEPPTTDTAWFALLEQHGLLTPFQVRCLEETPQRPLVLDDYILLEELGRGGMGVVYKARHRRMGRLVALKVLPDKALDSPEALRRFQREVHVAAKLSHPNIVSAFDARDTGGVHYLVMELVAGQNLAQVVRAQGPLAPRLALDLVRQAALGLGHAHQRGVIHRDIKPSNLMVCTSREREGTAAAAVLGGGSAHVLKILDMGLARLEGTLGGSIDVTTDDVTRTGAIIGTVDFMSPEQALDTRHADARSDLYSLGCTLYYLLTGGPVFEADTVMKKLVAHREQAPPRLRAHWPELPEDVDRLFARLVAKKPAERFQSADDLAQALTRILKESSLPERLAELGPFGPASSELTQDSPRPGAETTGVEPSVPPSEPAQSGTLGPLQWGLLAVLLVFVIVLGRSLFQTRQPDVHRPLVKGIKQPEGKPPDAKPPDQKPPDPKPVPPDEGKKVGVPPKIVIHPPAGPEAVRRAAQWVLDKGGRVVIAAKGKAADVRELPDAEFHLVGLVTPEFLGGPEGLALLSDLPHLRSLIIMARDLSPKGVVLLAQRSPALATLKAVLGNVRDEDVAELATLPRLECLWLAGPGLTNKTPELLATVTRLTELDLASPNITNQGVQHLAKLTNLRKLGISSSKRITDAGLAPLADLPHLEKLDLRLSSGITGATLPAMKWAPRLLDLSLSGCAVTDQILESFTTFTSLEDLDLRGTRISDRAAKAFAQMPKLKRLRLEGTGVSEVTIRALETTRPKILVYWDKKSGGG